MIKCSNKFNNIINILHLLITNYNSIFSGHGFIKYNNGSIYEGNFTEGKREGNGTFQIKN